MSKYQEYQEALNILKDIEQSHNYKKIGSSLTPESDLLQELVDEKLAKYTEEEIIKEWEKLGYEVRYFSKAIHLVKEDGRLGFEKTIVIAMDAKWYRPIYESDMYDEDQMYQYSEITMQEHQLLTKTFKMLGWEV